MPIDINVHVCYYNIIKRTTTQQATGREGKKIKKLEYISADKTLTYLTIEIAERHKIDMKLARKVLLDALLRNTVIEEILTMSDYTMEDEPT